MTRSLADWFPTMPDAVFFAHVRAYTKLLRQRGERPCWTVFRNGLVEYIIACEAASDCDGAHEASELLTLARDLREAEDVAQHIGEAVGDRSDT